MYINIFVLLMLLSATFIIGFRIGVGITKQLVQKRLNKVEREVSQKVQNIVITSENINKEE